MTKQNIDFGSGAENDGEFIATAFPKIQSNFDELYAVKITDAERSKLEGIEHGADVTDAENVAASGAFMKATDDSSNVKHTAAGAGVVGRTAQAKARETVSPADFGGDVGLMFAAAGAHNYIVPAGNYEFGAPITVPAGSIVRCEDGAIFYPTFEPTGADRATPLITLDEGVDINLLDVRLTSGIDTIRKLVELAGGVRLGRLIAKSVGLNNNRTERGSTDLISGALILSGSSNRVDSVDIDRFDQAVCWNFSQHSSIRHAKITEAVTGVYAHAPAHCWMGKSYVTGPNDPTEPNGFVNGRGVMTPGANALLIAGGQYCNWGDIDSFNVLEHAIRVGSGVGATYNTHNAFGTVRSIRPYGCGFKADDGDAFTIQHIRINQLYTEDVGNGNWFGTAGYTNWASGSADNPAVDNDGNKQACAIRNTRHARLLSFENRAVSQSESGYHGLWLERTQDAVVIAPDTGATRSDGVRVQSGGAGDIEKVYIIGPKVRGALGNGIKVAIPSVAGDVRGLSITDADVYGCTGYGVEVDARPNTVSPFAPTNGKSIISGRFYGNTAGVKNIAAAVAADADFVDEINAYAVDDDAYGSGWNGSTQVPTKNAVYDKIEALDAQSLLAAADARAMCAILHTPHEIAASGSAISVGATTGEEVLATIAIPAGAMGANGILRVYTQWSYTNGAATKTVRVRLGGVGGTAFRAMVATATARFNDWLIISNRNSPSSQIGSTQANTAGSFGTSGAAAATGTVDTSSAQDLVITGQKETSTDTLTLEAYRVEVIYRA